MATKPRVLFVDAYDSFSNNIVSLLETQVNVDVTKILIDDHIDDLPGFVRSFAAVLLGPGPGDPAHFEDVGLMNRIWQLRDADILPVFGICLGFQSLALNFGGVVSRLPQPRHGIENTVTSQGNDLWQGLGNVNVVQYHSLHAQLGHDTSRPDSGNSAYLWEPEPNCPDLVPLAWDFDRDCTEDGRDRQNPRGVLMSVRHRTKPFWGVQFHPESICSSKGARQVLLNWWESAQLWNQSRGRQYGRLVHPGSLTPPRTIHDFDHQNASDQPQMTLMTMYRPDTPPVLPSDVPTLADSFLAVPSQIEAVGTSELQYQFHELELRNLSVTSICEALNVAEGESIVLDSEPRQVKTLGDHSIIGLIAPDTVKIVYSVGDRCVRLQRTGSTETVHLKQGETVFSFVKEYMHERCLPEHSGAKASPFWGGLMGYITYEACLETIDVHCENTPTRPDLCFAFVERSVVVNHFEQKAYVQSIKGHDGDWIQDTHQTLSALSREAKVGFKQLVAPHPDSTVSFGLPQESIYHSKIHSCHSSIRAGNSYELCLTDQTTIHISDPSRPTPWSRYQALRAFNPAPFSAFIKMGPLTVLSTSPERFMSWSRPSVPSFSARRASITSINTATSSLPHAMLTSAPVTKQSVCQFRPIKGTVRKRQTRPDGSVHIVDHAEATATLNCQKERAENLMIVDLIRHDLHGVAGSGNVTTKSLMQVEEYEHVFQLVTVIEGTLHTSAHGARKPGQFHGHEHMHVPAPAGLGLPSPLTPSAMFYGALSGSGYFPSVIQKSTVSSASAPRSSTTTTAGNMYLNSNMNMNSNTIMNASAAQWGSRVPTPEPVRTKTTTTTTTTSSEPTGIDVLAASLPPGSMTGAPKKRSCEILTRIEGQRPRSIYSGLIGYMDVGGGGDFSVVIRTSFMWEDEQDRAGREAETWRIGAGGAVTGLSTPEGEWEEMLTKLDSNLGFWERGAAVRV